MELLVADGRLTVRGVVAADDQERAFRTVARSGGRGTRGHVRPTPPEAVLTARTVAALVGAMVAAWGCALLGPLSAGTPVLVGGAAAWLVSERRRVAALLVVLASPFTPGAVGGAVDYGRGTFAVTGVGLYDDDFSDTVEPWTRAERRTLGCVVSGNEWVWTGPYNLVGYALIGVLGPMAGAYVGPYPGWPTVDAALAVAPGLSAEVLRGDRVVVAGGPAVDLPAGCGAVLLDAADASWALTRAHGETCEQTPTAARVDGVLALRIPRCWRWPGDEGYTALVDPDSGRVFAIRSKDDLRLAHCTWLPEGRATLGR